MDKRQRVRLAEATCWMLQHWLALFLAFFGLFNLLPFLAPVAMKAGAEPLGNAIYTLFTPLCHQMAQRSFFLFGDQVMYRPEQLPLNLTGDLASATLSLKQFNGNEMLGWKVAWSDRMVYMYGATWLAAAAYAVVSRYRPVKRLSIRSLVILTMTMIVDGSTHMLSDFSNGGLFASFRYTNQWLADLTGNTFPASFYVGDTLGTFNSWIRLISGVGFGVAIVWISFPLIAQELRNTSKNLTVKLLKYSDHPI